MNQLTALAELLSERMQTVLKAGNSILLELGRIRNDLSLSVDSLKDYIPKGDYLLSLSLTGLTGDNLHSKTIAHNHSGGEHTQQTGNGFHTHEDGSHTHVLPAPLRGVKPGDRVLVVWAGGQPIVTNIITGSKDVTLDGRE